MVYFNKSK